MRSILVIIVATIVIIILFGFMYYLCNQRKGPISVGIVSMVTEQPDFEDWLDHHLKMVDKIYLKIDKAPRIVEICKKYPKNRVQFDILDSESEYKNNYFTLIDRQKDFVSNTLQIAKKDGIDFLFHIDADELIKVRSGNLKQCLLKIPMNFDSIHFKNFEAVFDNPSSREKCFKADGFMNCGKGKCTSYANGKSAAILTGHPEWYGPHDFKGNVYQMPENEIVVLHFDSCTYPVWEKKFKRLAKNATDDSISKIPFPFYKKSIELQKSNVSEAEKRKYFMSSKGKREGVEYIYM